MAKKASFRELYNQWSAQDEAAGPSVEERRRREDEAQAALQAYQDEFGELTSDQYREAINQFILLGRFAASVLPSFKQQPQEAPVVPEEAATVVPQERGLADDAYAFATQAPRRGIDAVMGEGYFDAAVDTAQAGLARSVRGAIGRARESDNPLLRALSNIPGAGADLATGNLEGYIMRGAGEDRTAQDVAALGGVVDRNLEAAAPARERLGSRNWLIRNLGEGSLDALASPSGAASLIGGPTGAVAVVDAYDQAYMQAVDAGVDSEEDREIWALSQAAPELVSFIPASKVLERLPVVGKAVDRLVKKPIKNLAATFIEREGSPALKAAARTINSAFGEALEEGFTSGVQSGAAAATAEFGEGELGALGQANAPTSTEDFLNDMFEGARAGFIMGGGLSAPGNVGQSYADRQAFVDERSAETEQDIMRNSLDALRAALPSAEPVVTQEPTGPAGADALREAGAIRNAEAEDAVGRELYWAERDAERARSLEEAFAAREQEVAAERELGEEAGFRTIERDATAPKDRVERYADVVERVPVQPAAEITTDQIAQEREAAAQLQRDSERVKVINEVNRRREAVSKKAAENTAKEGKRAETVARALRNKAIDELSKTNPQASDSEIADLLPAKVAELTAAQSRAKEQPAAKKATKKAAKKTTKPVAKKAAAQPVVSTNVTSSPFSQLKRSDNPLDRIQGEVAERLGQTAKGEAKAAPADYMDKVRAIARSLAGDSSGRAAAAEKLIKQGKVVVVPNASYLGRKNVQRAAEYDTGNGTTYIYTDYVGDNVHEAVMEGISHETGHKGQYNTRDGRSDLMTALLGDKTTSAAAKKLRAAAASGNKFAQSALERAKEDTDQRRKAGEENPDRHEDKELVAYAIGHENAGRTTMLGSAGGAIRDIVAGAKSRVREKLGMDLDISLNDLRSTMGKVLQEGVETGTNEQAREELLGMIYNKNSKGFDEAVARGDVYDSVDGNQKYVLSDADARIKNTGKEQLVKKGSIRLADLLDHPVLFKEHPEAADMRIDYVENLGPNTFGHYDPMDKSITVTKNLVEAKPDQYSNAADFRSGLMHEIQHYVQDVGGQSGNFYGDSTPRLKEAKRALKRADTASKQAVESLLANAGRLVEGRAAKEQVADIVLDRDWTDYQKARAIVDVVAEQDKVSPKLQEFVDDYISTRDAYNAIVEEHNAAARENHNNYLSNITEREAFFTQNNVDASLAELPTNPENAMRRQETDIETGIDPTRGRIDVPGETLGTAAKASGMTEPAFARWFGDSVVVNEDGTPKVMYTGTSKDTDFKAFKMPKNGVWFTSDPASASQYAVENDSMTARYESGRGFVDVNTASRVFPVYLKIENPYTVTKADFDRMNVQNYKRAQGQLFDELRAQGYDGVLWPGSPNVVAIKSPTQIKSVNNSGNFSEKTNDVLGMAAGRAKGAFRNQKVRIGGRDVNFGTFLTSLVANSKGLGATIRDEVELAKAAPVEFEAKANRLAGQYDQQLKVLAKQRGVTPEDLNREIRSELEELAELEGSASEYQAAFNAMTEKYGKAGEKLRQMRQLVDDLSVDFIRTYLDQGGKLTNKEKDDVRKVAANLGRYVHRFYASRLGRGLGDQYATAMQDAITAASKGKTLTPVQKDLFARYEAAAAKITDGILIPDAEAMAEYQDSQIDYLYDTWVGTDPTGVPREDKEQALLDMREEIGPEQLQEKVDAAAGALLQGIQENAATRYYDRGEKINTTILQKRSVIPKEIREFMGEVTDPAGSLVNTVSKQAELVARTKLMFALRNMASPQDLQPPGSAGNAMVKANNMKELTGEAYGPLRGYFASPALEAMIGDTSETLQNFVEAMTTNSRNGDAATESFARTAAKVWMRGASSAKAINIVGNLFRYPLNFVGSFGMLGLNGNFNVQSYGRGLSDAVDIIRYAARPSAGLGGAVLANKYRVVDSATVGDLKQLDLGKIERVIQEMSGGSKLQRAAKKYTGMNPATFMRAARSVGVSGRELYAMMDVWSKIANFHAEANHLKKLYKKEGITKSDDEIYREASAIVNLTNMSYSRTAPFVKAIERAGITQYGPYMYEAHRVVLANIYQGLREVYSAKDFKNPAAAADQAARGLARLSGTAATLGMLGALSHFAAGMWGDDEEEKRALLPEYARVMDFFNIGKDSSGMPILYAVSNIDPLGPITDLYRAARIGDQPIEAIWEQFKENYVAPALGGALYDAFARTTSIVDPMSSRPRKPLIAQWSPDGWSAAMSRTGNEDEWASIAHLIETRFMPGTARAWSDSNPIAAGGTTDEVAYNIARGLGARGIRFDPKVGVRDAAFNYDDTMKELRRELASYVENTTSPSAEEITQRLLTMRQAEKKAWDQIALTRRGVESLGLDDDEAVALMKEAGIPKETINQVMDETFASRVISKQSIKSAAKREVGKAKTEEEKQKVIDKWTTAWEILSELQGEE